MSMLALDTATPGASEVMTKLEAFLLTKESKTYAAYYNGKMSYKLAGQDWETYITQAFPNLKDTNTSENVYKDVIDLYAENLVPVPDELRGFSNVLVPLLSRGEAVVVVTQAGEVHFPEHYEMLSDGKFTLAAIYTRNLGLMKDFVTFVDSNGVSRVFSKPVPDDFTAATREGYTFEAQESGSTLFRFALDDKGFGASMAALQDRVNHSILDQTVVAEANVRPFWYLLNVDLPERNPYLPPTSQPQSDAMQEQKAVRGSGGRIFTTSADGPFGQLTPPDMSSMVSYHDSIIDKVSQSSGIPQHYFKPGTGTPPTGVALKVLSKRFNNKIARMREDLTPEMERLAEMLGVEKTAEVKDAEGKPEKEFELWNTSDDLLQESLDAHGLSLSQMGYPLEYIASVVTPGVDLNDYEEDGGLPGSGPNGEPGQPTDMTAKGQQGLVATPGQVAAYGQNPGQIARS